MKHADSDAIKGRDTLLFEKFSGFRRPVTDGLRQHVSEALRRHLPPSAARVLDLDYRFGAITFTLAPRLRVRLA
jgi:hypothetical protein